MMATAAETITMIRSVLSESISDEGKIDKIIVICAMFTDNGQDVAEAMKDMPPLN